MAKPCSAPISARATIPRKARRPTSQTKYLKAQQLALFQVIKQRDQDQQARQRVQKALDKLRPKAIYLGLKSVRNLQLSPDGRFVTYSLGAGAGQ